MKTFNKIFYFKFVKSKVVVTIEEDKKTYKIMQIRDGKTYFIEYTIINVVHTKSFKKN